jgi:L-ascorbate metabolism protein UlaG (beta-lactamase superfamily)
VSIKHVFGQMPGRTAYTREEETYKNASMSLNSVTWLGHATTRIEFSGFTVLTDPALTNRLVHLRRHYPINSEQYEDVDLVTISHLHMDHLHIPSLRRIGRDVTIVAPRGSGRLLSKQGFRNVIEMGVDDVLQNGHIEIMAVHAEHSSSRGTTYRDKADALGFVLNDSTNRVYFAGDTDYHEKIRTFGPIDVGLIPIGGWASRLGSGHLNPERAAKVVDELDIQQVIPIHWGTYSARHFSRRHPRWLNEPALRFKAELENSPYVDRLHILRPGEELKFQ